MCTLEAELKLKSYITYVTYSIWRNRQYIIRRIYRSGAPAQISSHQSHTTEDGASNRLNQGHCLNNFAFYSASICDVLFYCYSVTYHSLTSMFVCVTMNSWLFTHVLPKHIAGSRVSVFGRRQELWPNDVFLSNDISSDAQFIQTLFILLWKNIPITIEVAEEGCLSVRQMPCQRDMWCKFC